MTLFPFSDSGPKMTQVRLRWTPPLHPNGRSITSYRLKHVTWRQGRLENRNQKTAKKHCESWPFFEGRLGFKLVGPSLQEQSLLLCQGQRFGWCFRL